MDHGVLFTIFLIFSGAALLATVALYARQALIVAYIVMGMLVGPSVLDLVGSPNLVESIAEVGIVFLLYLLGLNLYPQKLLQMLRKATWVTLLSCVGFGAVGALIAWLFGYGWPDYMVVGAAMMFSSTILGLKLLPTTALHHRHAGEIIISVLLIQDVIAILILLAVQGKGGGIGQGLLTTLVALPGLIALAWAAERWVLRYLLHKFDAIQEYVFLLAVGWCMAIAQAAASLGLSYEIGAFIAGVALANSPISRFIAESLRPIRDFFLVMFFFALGAQLDLAVVGEVIVPALVLATVMLLGKPLVFDGLLRSQAEKSGLA